MATFSKQKLSGSTRGAPIKVVATASTGTTIHQMPAQNGITDEIWLYAYNSSASSVVLTIQFGGTTAVDNDIKVSIPATSGLTLVVPGLILQSDITLINSVYAYAGTANVITLSGYVNRIA